MHAASLLLLLFIAVAMTTGQQDAPELKVGDKAVDFNLPYATKDSVADESLHLDSLIGKKNIVLAFYPADWSGGCTKEVCTIRDNFALLGNLNAEIVGISGDYEYSHHEWAKYHNLPFMLAADHNHATAKAYHSFNPETGFNRRTVYVIDKGGKIAYMDLKYSTKDLASFDKLKDALKSLQ